MDKPLDISTPTEILQDPHFYHALGVGAVTTLGTRYLYPQSNRAILIGATTTALSYYYMRTYGHRLPFTESN
jgi:hypothetical protein